MPTNRTQRSPESPLKSLTTKQPIKFALKHIDWPMPDPWGGWYSRLKVMGRCEGFWGVWNSRFWNILASIVWLVSVYQGFFRVFKKKKWEGSWWKIVMVLQKAVILLFTGWLALHKSLVLETDQNFPKYLYHYIYIIRFHSCASSTSTWILFSCSECLISFAWDFFAWNVTFTETLVLPDRKSVV